MSSGVRGHQSRGLVVRDTLNIGTESCRKVAGSNDFRRGTGQKAQSFARDAAGGRGQCYVTFSSSSSRFEGHVSELDLILQVQGACSGTCLFICLSGICLFAPIY